MSGSKRPSTSSLRRYLTSRPYVPIADIRRRFELDPEEMSNVRRNGTWAVVGLPEREAVKLQELWERDEIGVELSVEVRAPVIVGVYPMRIARYVLDHSMNGNGAFPQRTNGTAVAVAHGGAAADSQSGTEHLQLAESHDA
jgi:hypothetical protein